MKNKIVGFIFAFILFLIASVIVFNSINLVFSVVSNYKSISAVSLAPIPLLIFTFEIVAIMISAYRIIVLKRDLYQIKRFYSILMMILSVLGIVFSIILGTVVYHTFVGEYVFVAYPLIMLIIQIIFFIVSLLGFVFNSFGKGAKEIKEIDDEVATKYRHSVKHVFKTIGFVLFIIFAMERMGALLLLPMLASPVNWPLALPYYIQLIFPTLCLCLYLLYRDFNFLNKNRYMFIALVVVIGYSLFSMIFTISMSNLYGPNLINSIANIQHLERLVVYPVVFILMYIVCLVLPFISLIVKIIKTLKNKNS